MKRSLFRSKKRVIRYGLLASNLVLIAAVVGFIINTRNQEPNAHAPVLNLVAEKELSDPLDALSGADIAVNVALMTGLPQTTAVINNADSHNRASEVISEGIQTVAKPQIITSDIKSVQDIQKYTVVDGDTIDSLATKFSVTSDSLRWSNGLFRGSNFEVNKVITIPPVDGFVYEVKSGDTIDSLTTRFSAQKERIIAFNDIEISGLVTGSKIVIPNGKKTAPVLSYAPSVSSYRAPVYGYNGYDFGYCTYYVANQISVPTGWGNAKWWDDGAARTPGWSVIYSPGAGEVPAGAILVSNAGYYGHVAYVESVNPDGSLFISEMNANWHWNVTSSRTVPVSRIGAYNYVVRN